MFVKNNSIIHVMQMKRSEIDFLFGERCTRQKKESLTKARGLITIYPLKTY